MIEKNPLSIEDVALPVVGSGQVLIEVKACGVCRSNLHMIEGDWVRYGLPAKSPIIPGHEVVGIIDALGHDVGGFNKGDRVGVQPLWSTCNKCEYCLSIREQLCPSSQWTGETVDGGYAEYLLATADHTYPIPHNVEDCEAAPLFCPGITAYDAVKKTELTPGKRIAVFGIGGVGHMVLQIARLYGAEVIAVSRSRQRLKLAEELGASRVVDVSSGEPKEWVERIGAVDASVVFAPSSALAQVAVKATKPGGVVVMGVYAELGEFNLGEEKRITGTAVSSRLDMREVLRLAAAGKIKAVSKEFRLDEANEVLKKLKNGEVQARAVLAP